MGSNNKEQLLFGDNNVLKEWINGEVDKLVGEILPVNIIKTNNEKTGYLVNEKYNATLPTIRQFIRQTRK